MSVWAYTLRRLRVLPLLLLGVSLGVFAILEWVPGDPATAILGPHATPERVAALREELGLGRPLPVRYVTWMGQLLRGDLGRSYSLNQPVGEAIAARVGPTLLLGAAALLVATVLGLLGGVLAAAHQGRAADRALTLAALAGLSMPGFWLALLLVFALGVTRSWFPVSGMRSAFGAGAGGLGDVLHHLALPALALGVVAGGVIARVARTAMLEALRAPHLTSLRARGVPEREVVYRSALRLAAVSVVPVLGLQAGFVLGGAVYVETVFAWPGLGRMLVEAILARDLLLVQGGVLVLAVAYVGVNLAADVAQRALDPRLSE